MEREILSKAAILVRSGDRFDSIRIFEFVRAHQARYPITCQCRVLFFSLFQWILPNYSMNSSGRCSNWFTTAGEN